MTLIDAKAAGRLLDVPHTWVLEEARHDRIPHIRLGRYVRFEPEVLLDWARNRRRGPMILREQMVAPAVREHPEARHRSPRRTDAGQPYPSP